MMLSSSEVWFSTKGELKEIRRGSVQGNQCILQTRKLLVSEMAWGRLIGTEKRFFKKREQGKEV